MDQDFFRSFLFIFSYISSHMSSSVFNGSVSDQFQTFQPAMTSVLFFLKQISKGSFQRAVRPWTHKLVVLHFTFLLQIPAVENRSGLIDVTSHSVSFCLQQIWYQKVAYSFFVSFVIVFSWLSNYFSINNECTLNNPSYFDISFIGGTKAGTTIYLWTKLEHTP